MKKNRLRSILVLIIAFSFTNLLVSSCVEDHPQPVTYGIQGLWIGTIADAVSGPQPYSMAIKPDGTVTFEGVARSQEHLGYGTWTLNGNTFTCNVTTVYGLSFNVGTQQTFTATFDKNTGSLSAGTWKNTSPANNSGTFSLTKVAYGIQGLWIGTIADAVSGPQPYSMAIKPDGTVTFEGVARGQEHLGYGTWTLNGTTFICDVTTVYGLSFNIGTRQTFTATFDSTTGSLSAGTWKNTFPANNSGTFSLIRVN